MADQEEQATQSHIHPAIAALRGAAGRIPMERTSSMDIRAEREELKEAAEQSLNVVLELGLDGVIRWVSPSWKDVVGTPPDSLRGKPIADILLSRKEAFAEAVDSMRKDDSRSQFVRFRVRMGSSSILKTSEAEMEPETEEEAEEKMDVVEQEQVLNLEGQGIMVYDRSSGGESHVSLRGQISHGWLLLIRIRRCGWYDLPQRLGKSL